MSNGKWSESTLFSIVGYNKFHIYHILPLNVSITEIRNLTSVLQSLAYRGKLKIEEPTFIIKKPGEGKRKLNTYRFKFKSSSA